jgi:flagellar hook assembly protein FlgD
MKYLLTLFLLFAFGTSSVMAQRSFGKDVRFARGKSSTTLQGTILDVSTSHTYSLIAKEGQRLQVRLTTNSSKVGFTVTNGSLMEGDVMLDEGRGTKTVDLPKDGEYQVIVQPLGVMGVSMIRNVRYTLKITIL